ncbi:hypothetical protein RRSWK_03447 [Rhodopirellula sp. SWK7]|nr:hypothetical protein RRSWK_03447 [Rhodopirellula sp. SWK7]
MEVFVLDRLVEHSLHNRDGIILARREPRRPSTSSRRGASSKKTFSALPIAPMKSFK